MDRIAWMRAVISAIVGAFLIIYAVLAKVPSATVLIILGLLLLGVVSMDALPIRRGRDRDPPD